MKTLLLFLSLTTNLVAQSLTKEKILLNEINKIRIKDSLFILISSENLTYVAKTHLNEMFAYRPNKNENYNWFGVGTAYIFKNKEYCKLEMMSCKPSELTNFKGGAYEFLLVGEDNIITNDEAISLLTKSIAFNKILLDENLKTIGVAVYKNICSIWLGF